MGIPILFGRFLVREGKISEQDLRQLVQVQSELNSSYALAAIEGEFITIDEFKKTRSFQREKLINFRDALKELQIADDEKLAGIDESISSNNVRIGELLVQKGILSDEELKQVLADFKERGTLATK